MWAGLCASKFRCNGLLRCGDADMPSQDWPVTYIKLGTIFAGFAACIFAANIAQANSKQNWQDCRADHPDRNIAGCSRIIEGKGESAKTRSLALYLRGSAYGERSDYAKALADYDEAIRLNPANYDIFISRGLIYEAKGDKERAIADYTEAIRLNPKLASIYFTRANAYEDKGEHDLAYADYTEAIKLYSKHTTAYYNRGLIAEKKGNLESAIADYSAAIKIQAGYTAAYVSRANAYRISGDRDHAIADYKRALAINPTLQAAKDGLKLLGIVP
jgi:tetratricopeptide (TPR) repeat protein